MDPAQKIPTLADLDALPANVKGEIIEGVLYTMTRPRSPHQHTGVLISSSLVGPFDRGISGPGGWWILPEPGIELPNTPEILPTSPDGDESAFPCFPRTAPSMSCRTGLRDPVADHATA